MNEQIPVITARSFNPLYFHVKASLRDPAIRYIFLEGGASGSKTYAIAQALSVDQLEHNYSSVVFRRQHVDLKDSVYSSFQLVNENLGFTNVFWTFQQDLMKSTQNSAIVRFRGLDNVENIKGIEKFNVVWNNEWSQFLEDHFSQQRKRLRGRPNQKFICDWNPISAKLWQYENWLDMDVWEDLPLTIDGTGTKYNSLDPEHSFKRINKKGNSIWIKVTYRDNYWIVGHPSGKGGFVDQNILDDFAYDKQYHPNLYRIYADGERGVMRTGSEFLTQFNEINHVRPLAYDPATTIHICVDNNNDPYCAVAIWQIDMQRKELKQIHEIPAKAPDNNAQKAALLVVKYLQRLNYTNVIYVYGDASATNRSTVDINNASFFQKFIETLQVNKFRVQNKVGRSNPMVALSADFINEIFEFTYKGWSIVIGDSCKISIDDYIMAKQLPDGTMEKKKVKNPQTGIMYEPIGHFVDCLRYIATTILQSEWFEYSQRNSRVLVGGVSVITRTNQGNIG